MKGSELMEDWRVQAVVNNGCQTTQMGLDIINEEKEHLRWQQALHLGSILSLPQEETDLNSWTLIEQEPDLTQVVKLQIIYAAIKLPQKKNCTASISFCRNPEKDMTYLLSKVAHCS